MSDSAVSRSSAPGGREFIAAAKSFDYDRYVAALLVPAERRGDLLALVAFAGEIAAIPERVVEPRLGQIRLQWWREALQSAESERTGHPLADNVRQILRRHGIAVEMMLGLVDAVEFQLERRPMPDAQHLKAYLVKTEGALFNASARVLGEEGPALDAASEMAGMALGRARLVLGFCRHLTRGRVLLPMPERLLDRLEDSDFKDEGVRRDVAALLQAEADAAAAEAREAMRLVESLPASQRAAFLPIATVEGDMGRWKRLRLDPLREFARPRPLRHLWQIWRTHKGWGRAT